MNRIVLPLVVLLLLACGDRAAAQGKPIKLPSALDVKPLKAVVGDDALVKLQKERFNAALAESLSRYHELRFNGTGMTLLLAAIQRLSESERTLQSGIAEQLETYKKIVGLLHHIETLQEARFKGGEISRADLSLAHYAHLDAQIRLLEAQRAAKANKGK